jgi:hypothetical protein
MALINQLLNEINPLILIIILVSNLPLNIIPSLDNILQLFPSFILHVIFNNSSQLSLLIHVLELLDARLPVCKFYYLLLDCCFQTRFV